MSKRREREGEREGEGGGNEREIVRIVQGKQGTPQNKALGLYTVRGREERD